MNEARQFFIVQVGIRIRQTHPNSQLHLTEGGNAHAIVSANSQDEAVGKMVDHLALYHWDALEVTVCQPTDPAAALGHPHLERMLAKAAQFGIGAEIFPAAFQKAPGQAS